MGAVQAVVDKLFGFFQTKGYVTEDEIFNECEDHDLDLVQIDYVSNQLLDRGVLIGDAPLSEGQKGIGVAFDYTQTDYDEIFLYFEKHYPGMSVVLNQIQKVIPPQKGEMEQLIKQTRSGNLYTREILIQKNMRLALKMAYSYRGKTTIPLEDIFQVAVMGIMKAIESYDPYSHSYFTSYCSTWMMQYIDRYIYNRETLIRLPVHVYDKIKLIRQWREESSEKELITLVQSEYNIDGNNAVGLISYSELDRIQSLDQLMNEKEELLLYDDFNLEEYVDKKLVSYLLFQAISRLSAREKDVLLLRYGLLDDCSMTLEKVGSILSVTRERVRQIESSALRKLRFSPQVRSLKTFLEDM